MGRPSKVEDEAGAFKVLLCLIEDEKTPKVIAEELNLSPSTVVFHLNRLRKAGFVERLEKIGKLQPYRIKWQVIENFFLEICLPILELSETLPKLKKENIEQFRALVNDSCFHRLVYAGLETLNKLLKENPKAINFGLKSYFKAFHNALTQYRVEDFNLEGCSFLFQNFIKKLVETKRFDEKSWRWIQTLKSLGYLSYEPFHTNL